MSALFNWSVADFANNTHLGDHILTRVLDMVSDSTDLLVSNTRLIYLHLVLAVDTTSVRRDNAIVVSIVC